MLGTRVGWLFNLLSGRPIKFDGALVHRLRTPPPLPTTSIYTRQDGVVAWQTCIHHKRFQQTEDIEVVSSHLGMGWNPAVMSIIADRLAQHPHRWTPYRRRARLNATTATVVGRRSVSAQVGLAPNKSPTKMPVSF